MTTIGFHGSQEQISPAQLLSDVQHAEQAGFEAAMSSDHFMPWSHRQGHSGFTFSWLGAALAATTFPIGSVCAPGHRYHPAIVAQATATLGHMFEGRYWSALGAGQLMNEHVVGGGWPSQDERRSRLAESAELIRRLHRGEWITEHHGQVEMHQAHLFDRPQTPVPLYAACVSAESARRAADWAEGMITLNQPGASENDVKAAYRDAGGTGPVILQVHLSWAETDAKAEVIAHDQWRTNIFGPPLDQDLPTPEHFDAAAAEVSADTVRQAVWTSSSPAAHTEWIAAAAETFDAVYLHHVGQHQQPWLDTAGEQILPALKQGS